MTSYAAHVILMTARRHAHDQERTGYAYDERSDDRDMHEEKGLRYTGVPFSCLFPFFFHVAPVFFMGCTNTS